MYKLLNRFPLAQKFMVLGLIAFVLVCALTYLLVSAADKGIDLVRQEIKGSVSIVPVMSLLQTVQQHRGLSSLLLSGKNEVIPSWDAKRKEVDQAVEAIDAVNKRFPELNLTNDWHTFKGQWQKLKTDVAELSPLESFYRHTALTELIMNFLNLIADNSNIIYDQTTKSHTLGQILSSNIPMNTEFMGRIRAFGAVLLGKQKASESELTIIYIYAGLAQHEFKKLNLALDKIYAVNPELKSVFKASHQEMENKVKEALKLVNEQLINSKKFDYPSQQYFAALTSAIDAQFAFSGVVNEQLQISLNAQANRLATEKYTELIIALLLFALCVAVAMVVVRGILIQVRSVTKALESFAQGDMGTRTDMPDSSDEFVQIARSFDGMAAALQARQSEAARAEEEIRQLNTELSQFKDTLDKTLDCVFMFRLDTLRFTYVNQGAMQQTGYSETELLQMTPVDIKPQLTLEQFQQVIQPLVDGVQPSITFQTVHRHKDGHDIPVEIFLQLVRLEDQEPHFVAIVQDISARKENETRLLNAMNEANAANAAKSTFMSNMSHELRTPMNSIIGMSHLALKTHLNAKQHDYLAKIDYSAHHLLELIDDILDFSKMETNQLQLEVLDFKLDTVVKNLTNQLGHSAASKGLRLKFDLDHSLSVPLLGDPLRLTQVLLNCTSNAIKFASKGDIVIRARIIEEGVNDFLMRFEVQDSGIGLSTEQIEKLFQLFHQADASTTRKYGGTGLGLVICKQLVELMGGKVGVESQYGHGSTFWFTARLAKGGHMPASIQTAAPDLGMLKDASILLVEDNLFNQEVAVELLRVVGVVVSIANNGQEAIDMLLKQRFDCVLMDVQMPVMDGIEATRQIRSHPAIADTHIIAMTANASKEDRALCFAAGMNNFISKPVYPDELYATIAQHMRPGQFAQKIG